MPTILHILTSVKEVTMKMQRRRGWGNGWSNYLGGGNKIELASISQKELEMKKRLLSENWLR